MIKSNFCRRCQVWDVLAQETLFHSSTTYKRLKHLDAIRAKIAINKVMVSYQWKDLYITQTPQALPEHSHKNKSMFGRRSCSVKSIPPKRRYKDNMRVSIIKTRRVIIWGSQLIPMQISSTNIMNLIIADKTTNRKIMTRQVDILTLFIPLEEQRSVENILYRQRAQAPRLQRTALITMHRREWEP